MVLLSYRQCVDVWSFARKTGHSRKSVSWSLTGFFRGTYRPKTLTLSHVGTGSPFKFSSETRVRHKSTATEPLVYLLITCKSTLWVVGATKNCVFSVQLLITCAFSLLPWESSLQHPLAGESNNIIPRWDPCTGKLRGRGAGGLGAIACKTRIALGAPWTA